MMKQPVQPTMQALKDDGEVLVAMAAGKTVRFTASGVSLWYERKILQGCLVGRDGDVPHWHTVSLIFSLMNGEWHVVE